MNICRLLLVAGLFSCTCIRARTTCHDLFVNASPESVPYRIPAIAAYKDGSLVAISDYRHCRADIGFGRVDLRCRLSGNNGQDWSEERVIAEGDGISGLPQCGFGDAAVVWDRESGELLVLCVCGETVYWKESTTRQNPNRIAAFRSQDKGRTWSGPEDITESIYSLFDTCSEGCVQSCFVASGKIFQSRTVRQGSHYRIYAALCARPNGNRVIYSDDFGRTWHALGGAEALPAPGGDEPKCEELPDGSVILSSRTHGGRLFNIFRYGNSAADEAGWGKAVFSGEGNNGCTALDNSCNGEILVIPAESADGRSVSLVLQTVPLGKGRRDVGVYYKELPEDTDMITPASLAAEWEKPFQLSETASAYSSMALQADGRIAFFYEETPNADGTGYNMIYKALPVSTITSGRYK